MARYASVKRRTKDAKAPCIATLIHNARLDKNIEYLLPKHLRLSNYHLTPISNAKKTFTVWKKENEDRYQKINGRKLRKDARKLESILIILSEEQVNKCHPDEIWEKAKVFNNWFEMKYETKTRTMDWHRDEGHSDEDENDEHKLETRNNHIHLEFDNVNKQGKMVRRLFSKGDLKIFQDKIAEIYAPLGFVRGKDTAKKHRNDNPKRGIGQEAFRSKKKAESREQNIKKEMELLREELQKWQAKDSHYIQLAKTQEELQKKLTEQEINYMQAIKEIKDKSQKIIDELRAELKEQNKTIEEKNIHIASNATKIQEIQQKNNNLESDALKTASQHMLAIKELQDKNDEEEVSINNLIEHKDQKINELQGDISLYKIIDVQKADNIKILNIQIEKDQKIITEKNAQIDSDTKILKDNQEKIKVLGKQVQEFQDKEPEKIEVIKEVPRELIQEEIMQLEIKTEQGPILVGEIVTKHQKAIVEKNKEIKELKELAYTGNTYKNSDKPFPYKQRSKKQTKQITTLQTENKKLQKKLDEKPTQESMEQDAMHIAYLMDENEKLQELAYFDDVAYNHEAQEPYPVEKSYKSVVEYYRTQMSETNKNLYQIENTLFDSNKKRDTEVIVEEAQRLKNNYSSMNKIFNNASKYLQLTPEKFGELFEKDVPSKNKVLLSEIVEIKKESPNTTSTSLKMGR